MCKYKSEYDFTKIPLDRIVRVGQISMLHNNIFTVSWLLGRYCNYKCSYCWAHGRSDKKDHRSTELCLKTIDSIKEQAESRGFNSFHFSLSGGEPTLHPGYFDILDRLASDLGNYTSIHMTTNLSRGYGWFGNYLERAMKFDRASITASLHREYVTDREVFANKLLFLQKYGIKITVNMVMVPNIFDELYDIAKYFCDKGLNTTLKPQSDPHASYVVKGYTEDQLSILHNGMPQLDGDNPIMQVELTDDNGHEWYMDQAERFNAFNFNCFKGWECSAGYRSIIIREPCGSIKRSYSCSDEPIGNIETGFKLYETIQPCISESCVSSADSKIPKRKQGSKLSLWNIN
jgi:MoaA/NifB/PqqE/SkfB family radical SAM enzyme